MVIRSSCVLPPSDSRRKRAAQALFDHSLLALDLPANTAQFGRRVIAQRAIGIKARTQRTCQLRQLCPRGQLAQRLEPIQLCGHGFGRALDQRLPAGDVVHQEQQVANLFRLEQGSLDARLIGQLGGIEQAAQRRRDPLPEQQAHLAYQIVLLVNPGSVPRGLHAPAATREPRGNGRNSPPAPAGGSIRAPRSCIPPPSTELALKDSLDHARAIAMCLTRATAL